MWFFDKVTGGPDGEPMTVAEVMCGTLVFEGGGAAPAYTVTHREPGSLEKAMERFQGIIEDHDGLEPDTEGKLWDVHRRLTALMERGV